jgi:hypothetical protein
MKVYELLAKPESWTKKAPARNKHGKEVNASYSEATCWCLAGAICKLIEEVKIRASIYKQIHKEIDSEYTSTVDWNDAPERTHQDVIDLCKKLDI